jgi:hypothetical protein
MTSKKKGGGSSGNFKKNGKRYQLIKIIRHGKYLVNKIVARKQMFSNKQHSARRPVAVYPMPGINDRNFWIDFANFVLERKIAG